MLVISRRKGQRISIGDDIELVVTELHRSSVKLGIRAPRGYAVLRGEVRDSIEEANREAAETDLEAEGFEQRLGIAPSTAAGQAELLTLRQSTGAKECQKQDAPRELEIVVVRRGARTSSTPGDDNDTANAR